VGAELEVLGMDVSRHVIDFHAGMLADLAAGRMAYVRSVDLLRQRSRSECFVAGVRRRGARAVRGGRRVVFLTLDERDRPGGRHLLRRRPGPSPGTVFGSWLLLVRGEVRRTGPRGHLAARDRMLEATRCRRAWLADGLEIAALVQEQVPVDAGAGPSASAGARQRLPAVAVRRHQAAGRRRLPAGRAAHASPGSSGWWAGGRRMDT